MLTLEENRLPITNAPSLVAAASFASGQGINVGDPDGLWQENAVMEITNRVRNRQSGTASTLSIEELRAKLGLVR